MNQILMTWNPGLANEDTWDPISSRTLSWRPSWQASSMLKARSPEGHEEEIERADDGDGTPRTFRGQSFSGAEFEHAHYTERNLGVVGRASARTALSVLPSTMDRERDMDIDPGWGRTA
jgi:hypothetical protein